MSGNEQSNLAYLWMKTHPSVEYYLLSLIRDKDRAEDVLQQVALAVTEQFDEYDTSRPFVAWAMGIARNKALQHFSQAKADRHRFDIDLIDELTNTQQRLSEEVPLRAKALEDCMQLLSKRSQLLLDRRYRQDMKPGAIASDLGVSSNSISVALHKIRKALANCIDQKIEGKGTR